VLDPHAPIPYVITDLGRRDLAAWRAELDEVECPQHEWEYAIGRGLVCQNCCAVAEMRQSLPDHIQPRTWGKWR
jgi:hypothetical protein